MKYIPKDVGLAVDFSLNGDIIISKEVSGMYTVCGLHLCGGSVSRTATSYASETVFSVSTTYLRHFTISD